MSVLTEFDGQLVAGGYLFDTLDWNRVDGIAAWDGSSWSPVGSGLNNQALSLTVYNGQLIAGGYFDHAGTVPANYIAAWDGSSWSPLGAGLNGPVLSLAVYNGQLVAGGWFDSADTVWVNHVAVWDGNSWSPLDRGIDGIVKTLTVHNGQLVAGGEFYSAGDSAVSHVAAWTGSVWTPLSWGADASVEALCDHKGALIAGGWFNSAGETLASRVAAWNDSAWAPMGSGIHFSFDDLAQVNALAVYDNQLIAGGDFSVAGDISANGIAAWDGSAWHSLDWGVSRPVLSLAVYKGQLIAGGYNSIDSWNGTYWSSISFSEARALAVYNGALVSGGVNSVALWDGSSWTTVGVPTLNGTTGWINALAVNDGKLIAAGLFDTIGGVAANGIASWNGSAWSSMNAYPKLPWIYSLTQFNGQLVAGGSFDTLGGVSVKAVAAWNGSTWSPLGSGLQGNVRALGTYSGRLIAGGWFWQGGPIHSLAAWDGATWSELGTGLYLSDRRWPEVNALTVFDSLLVVGGYFAQAGGGPASAIAGWCDGQNQTPTAVIDSIVPDPSTSGSPTHFGGHGDDPDGSIIAYSWRSNLDGQLSDQAAFTTTTLSIGTHVIYLKAQDNDSAWSPEASATLTVNAAPPNQPPSAVIDSVVPNPTLVGTVVRFRGHGTDPDGSIIGYNWRSSLDGQLSTQASFNSATLSVGDHTIYFKVQDDDSAWSSETSASLTITPLPPNKQPTATVDSIAPAIATAGTQVRFGGHGTDPDGSIIAYNWWSNLDGQLSTQVAFSTTTLSVGDHTIYFKVQDDDSAWSPEVSKSLTVVAACTDTCGVLCDDFTTIDTTTEYQLYHYASWDAARKLVQLTPSAQYRYGRCYLRQRYWMNDFRVSFDFWMGGGDYEGADGMVFAFTRNKDYGQSGGEWLDFSGADGFGIVLNTYANSGDPSEEWVGIAQNGPKNPMAYWVAPNGALEGGAWRRLTVENHSGHVQVWLDDTLRVDYQIPGYTPFLGYFGFTAATWGAWNYHWIDNLHIQCASPQLVTDLACQDISFQPAIPREGQSLTVTATVVNSGDSAAGSFLVEFRDQPAGSLLGVDTVPGLAPGAQAVVSAEWPATCQKYNVTVVIDPDNRVAESNEQNNTTSKPLNVICSTGLQVAIDPASQTVGVGDSITYDVSVANFNPVSTKVGLSVSGLPVGWAALEKDSVWLSAGGIKDVALTIHTPNQCAGIGGTYPFQIAAGSADPPLNASGSAVLIVDPSPAMSDLVPISGQTMGTNDVAILWNTLDEATSQVFYRPAAVSTFTELDGVVGTYHEVILPGLTRNTQYFWYIRSTSACGTSQSEIRSFKVGNGVVFAPRPGTFQIQRDYNQIDSIRVENQDNKPHTVLVEVLYKYEDLIVGFVGDGSTDQSLELAPSTSAYIAFAIHAQDAKLRDYDLVFRLTADDSTSQPITDYAPAHVHLNVPNVDFQFQEVSLDSLTLIRTMRVVNTGDALLSDLKVEVEESFGVGLITYPNISHARLAPGRSIQFQLIPIFPDTGGSGSVKSVLADGACGGRILATAAGVTRRDDVSGCCDKTIYRVQASNVVVCQHEPVESWYCTNNLVCPRFR